MQHLDRERPPLPSARAVAGVRIMKARSGDRAIASATLGADRGGDAHDATGTRTAADLANGAVRRR